MCIRDSESVFRLSPGSRVPEGKETLGRLSLRKMCIRDRVCSMSVHGFRRVLIAVVFIHAFTTLDQAQLQHPSEEVLINNNLVGHSGGRLVVSLRSEPKTLNPVTSTDISSREVIAQMAADLIHINRLSQPVSYTHLDVYKRQPLVSRSSMGTLSIMSTTLASSAGVGMVKRAPSMCLE